MRAARVSDYSTLLKRKPPGQAATPNRGLWNELRGQVETYHGRLGLWSRETR